MNFVVTVLGHPALGASFESVEEANAYARRQRRGDRIVFVEARDLE